MFTVGRPAAEMWEHAEGAAVSLKGDTGNRVQGMLVSIEAGEGKKQILPGTSAESTLC